MRIVQSYLKKNPCYTAGKKITVKGLMLHSVGCPQPRAAAFIESWNKESFDRACVHAFVDGNDGFVYQTLPWNHRGWHCGKGANGSGNNSYIGVEMCEPSCIKYTKGSTFTCSDPDEARAVAKRTYASAVELFAFLCEEYKLDLKKDGVIISHKEGHGRGIASNHGDPEHLWKQLGLSYTMDGFRSAVKKQMDQNKEAKEKADTYPEKLTSGYYRVRKEWKDAKSQKGAYRILTNAKDCADKYAGYSVFNPDGKIVYSHLDKEKEFRVRVNISNLNIRKGPGTHYAKIGEYTGKGVFTIVEESYGLGSQKGWGRLKSDKGWIALDYGERI